MSPKRNYESAEIFGVKVASISLDQLVEEIEFALKNHSTLTYRAVDPNKLNLAASKKDLRDLYDSFDLVTPDSIGTLLAAKMLGKERGGERVSGDLLAPRLYRLAREKEIKFYFLGGEKGKAEKAKETLKHSYPWLEIVGTHHGYFEIQGEESEGVVREIKERDPDVIFVGMGSPKEEKWIAKNEERLRGKVFIPTGAYFDMAAENPNCYPDWAYKYKLNWLYRMLREPARLAPRYLIGLPLFFARVLRQRLQRAFEN